MMLDGKVALVTGAGQGVGQGIALALAAEGAKVAVTGRTFEKLEATSALIAERGGAWVFTSATLAIGDDFSHVASRLGVPDARHLKLDSPFDFGAQSRLYLPPGLPAPGAPDYTARMLDAVLPLIAAADGRAFLLFTSHRALNTAARILRDSGWLGAERQLLVQGEAPREKLLDSFRALGDAVLLGTASFREGVDVRGSALTLVKGEA